MQSPKQLGLYRVESSSQEFSADLMWLTAIWSLELSLVAPMVRMNTMETVSGAELGLETRHLDREGCVHLNWWAKKYPCRFYYIKNAIPPFYVGLLNHCRSKRGRDLHCKRTGCLQVNMKPTLALLSRDLTVVIMKTVWVHCRCGLGPFPVAEPSRGRMFKDVTSITFAKGKYGLWKRLLLSLSPLVLHIPAKSQIPRIRSWHRKSLKT